MTLRWHWQKLLPQEVTGDFFFFLAIPKICSLKMSMSSSRKIILCIFVCGSKSVVLLSRRNTDIKKTFMVTWCEQDQRHKTTPVHRDHTDSTSSVRNLSQVCPWMSRDCTFL